MSDAKLKPIPKDLIFALDIGTRNVVGTIARMEQDQYLVLDYEVMAHPDRAMFDGQIHDIDKVTDIVKSVVDRLQTRNGFRLERAAIAAAGRALRTERAKVARVTDFTKEINKQLTDSLEMEAIQTAQNQLVKADKITGQYYCVGYSVINYYLDNSMILNPLGHKGNELAVEIIATFLPHIVVDSLYAVLHKAGLEVMNLTLEPIAAMNVAIPQNLRLLNLALVDVGAGTSDIALSKDGTVTSYGMVALAGDSITEQLAKDYLMDFNMAESLKVKLNQFEDHTFTDILGISYTQTTEEIMAKLMEKVETLTSEIANHILELNKKPPSAVFCIGGGSQIPCFTEKLAQALELPKERVVIKSVDTLDKTRFLKDPLKGPEYITPIGIGVTAFEEREHDFIQVNVNDNTVRLFNSKTLHVSDALILAGIHARSLLSERGPTLHFTLDGKAQEVRGEYGEPATIYVNGVLSSLDGKLNHKDQVTIAPATQGQYRKVTLDKVANPGHTFVFKGQHFKIIEYVSVNGVNRTGDYFIQNEDVIETKGIKTIRDLCRLSEINERGVQFIASGKQVGLDYEIQSGDMLDYHEIDIPFDYEMDDDTEYVEFVDEAQEDVSSTLSHKMEEAKDETSSQVINKNTKASVYGDLELTINGSLWRLPKDRPQMVFVDVFNHIDFDISKPQGILVLKLNGERARYTDTLKAGDIIEIKWK